MTGATDIDTTLHAIETCNDHHKQNPIADERERQLTGPALSRACDCLRKRGDIGTGQAMLLGACLAGQACRNTPVAAVHAPADPIGGHFRIAHRLSNSLVLPQVPRLNLPQTACRCAELADIVAPSMRGSEAARAQALILAMQQIDHPTGSARTRRQVGIGEPDLDWLADEAKP